MHHGSRMYFPSRPPRNLASDGATLPGIAVCLAIAAIATGVGNLVPVVGSAVPAIVFGAVLGAVIRPGRRLQPGIKFAGRFFLQLAVVILGTQLSFGTVVHIGATSLPVMLTTLMVCLVLARVVGRLLHVNGTLQALIGAGTGICGASAIAAVAPVIGAASADIAYAVSTIFLFNICAVVSFPIFGHLLHLSQQSFGLFAGTAVNDTSSVVAAATTYGAQAANHAVVVKLVRTLMIIPITVGLAVIHRRRAGVSAGSNAVRTEQQHRRVRALSLIPWFLVGFMLMAMANSCGLIPTVAEPTLARVSSFLIAIALSGIGLATDVAGLLRTGHRPLLLGAMLWVAVTATSLGVQHLSGTL